MVLAGKKELNKGRKSPQNTNQAQGTTSNGGAEGTVFERRVLRSKYLGFKNRICDERDDIAKVDSDKFKSILKEVDSLHQQVTKPREQVADAEALFDITTTLVGSVKALSNDGVTPAEFVSCLLRDFGQQSGASTSQDEARSLINWEEIGKMVSHVFSGAPGCRTMVGPMNTELKQRKNAVHKKRTKPTENARPEELEGKAEEKTDTDKNMATMFNILRKNRKVKLENLILNRNSFAQTVENLFALSFLIKDGRAEIAVNENGQHLVSPKNAPTANAISSGEASYSHFIFRFDFKDWKLMVTSIGAEEELMPHRTAVEGTSNPRQESNSEEEEEEEQEEQEQEEEEEESALPTTPIRKFSRNRGTVVQEQGVVEDSPDRTDDRAVGIRKRRRKLV